MSHEGITSLLLSKAFKYVANPSKARQYRSRSFESSAELTDNRRTLIRDAALRIKDIANDILTHDKDHKNDLTPEAFQTSKHDIYKLLNNIISEKRLEFSKRDLIIKLISQEKFHSYISKIHPERLKRSISNLINNSVGSLSGPGKIIVKIAKANSLISIVVKDNGCGIPHHITPVVMNEGFTYGKPDGAGLGLSYVKYNVERMGGAFHIHSDCAAGTTAIINLQESS